MPETLAALLAGRQGHFLMESGYHGEHWIEFDRLFADPVRLRPFVAELARRLAAHRIDAVCGPMTGGAKLAALVAAELGLAYFYTERHAPPAAATGALFPVRYPVPAADRARLRGRSVALVDDAISAGSAIRGSHADLLACGARPAVIGALFVFGDAAHRFAAQHRLALESLAPMRFGIWPPDDCPLCRAGLPLETVSDTP